MIGNIERSTTASAVPANPRLPLVAEDRGVLDHRGRHLVMIARLLAWSGAGALMVHCALGEDRTGVVIAVVLAPLGVTRSAILDDQAILR